MVDPMTMDKVLYEINTLEVRRNKLLSEMENSLFVSVNERLSLEVGSINQTLELQYKKYAIMKKVQ